MMLISSFPVDNFGLKKTS